MTRNNSIVWVGSVLPDPERPDFNHERRRKIKREAQRRAKRPRLRRAWTPSTTPDGSLLSEQTQADVAAGNYAFEDAPLVRTRPSRKERAREARQARIPKPTFDVQSCVVPWVPLITPIAQDELDRMRAAKRLLRKSRQAKITLEETKT